MACNYLENIDSIPFVCSLEIPCGFVYNADEWKEAMFIDSHCLYLINEETKQQATLPNGGSCEICVKTTVLVGALHYTIDAGKFIRKQNAIPTVVDSNNITSSQSICVHKLPVAINCSDCKEDGCSTEVEKIKFIPVFERTILYTNNRPDGVLLSAEPIEFINQLKDNGDNANGCKTIVLTGKINIEGNQP